MKYILHENSIHGECLVYDSTHVILYAAFCINFFAIDFEVFLDFSKPVLSYACPVAKADCFDALIVGLAKHADTTNSRVM